MEAILYDPRTGTDFIGEVAPEAGSCVECGDRDTFHCSKGYCPECCDCFAHKCNYRDGIEAIRERFNVNMCELIGFLEDPTPKHLAAFLESVGGGE